MVLTQNFKILYTLGVYSGLLGLKSRCPHYAKFYKGFFTNVVLGNYVWTLPVYDFLCQFSHRRLCYWVQIFLQFCLLLKMVSLAMGCLPLASPSLLFFPLAYPSLFFHLLMHLPIACLPHQTYY